MINIIHHRVHIKRLIALLLLSIILYSCATSEKTPVKEIPQPKSPTLEVPFEKPHEQEAPVTNQCIKGYLSLDYPISLPYAWDAVNEALAILELGLSYSYLGSNEGTIDAAQMDGDKISIKLKQLTGQTTSIAIKSTQFNSCENVLRIQKEIETVSGL